MKLGSPAQRHLRPLLDLLQRGIVTTGDLDALTHLLGAALGASGVMLAQPTVADGWNAGVGVPAQWLAKHREFAHEDPSAEVLSSRPPGTFYFVASELREEHLRSRLGVAFSDAGLRDGAVARLYNPFVDDLFLAVYRVDGEPIFDDDDRLLLELLHPHLSGALAARCALGLFSSPSTALTDAHAILSCPTRRIEWSRSARRLWAESVGLPTAAGWKSIERALWRAAGRFDSARFGGRSQLLVPGLRAEFANVPPDRGETRRTLVWLLAEPIGAQHGASTAPAAELLTPRELTIAHAAASGDSLAAIAIALQISRETVRTHLRKVYRKLHISRRVELAMTLGIAGRVV